MNDINKVFGALLEETSLGHMVHDGFEHESSYKEVSLVSQPHRRSLAGVRVKPGTCACAHVSRCSLMSLQRDVVRQQ